VELQLAPIETAPEAGWSSGRLLEEVPATLPAPVALRVSLAPDAGLRSFRVGFKAPSMVEEFVPPFCLYELPDEAPTQCVAEYRAVAAGTTILAITAVGLDEMSLAYAGVALVAAGSDTTAVAAEVDAQIAACEDAYIP